jgi:hypothetical protein
MSAQTRAWAKTQKIQDGDELTFASEYVAEGETTTAKVMGVRALSFYVDIPDGDGEGDWLWVSRDDVLSYKSAKTGKEVKIR